MISIIPGMPENVVAVTAAGQVTGEDYQTVLIPKVDQALARSEKIRFLYHIGPEFKKFTTTALWDDAKVGLQHWREFERIAVVTDVEWICTMVRTLGAAMPGAVQTFTNGEIEDAKTWITE